ncbi:hypothetical protein PPL_11272 [Heterostelium album PN500]|uniref:Uncharacterized protein n=1 Tax=Heterostelium pallidum (strain ATCC 26659 / Pp 5 / PN500) TaxID=670386 RepID=D3BU12_HETP5|nr:hypothetical protein PPL_11272 [Heterostelium album PN500]EFA75198.1 hypothetical protein PPL_11272 [Heterostelium album PN500]|eukprot:XP_020427332.1 hypothetical protein PPL_11272 [Heterostelium album PN500]
MSFLSRWYQSKKNYDISMYAGRRRYLLVVLAEIQIVVVCGIVFGWSSLQEVLINQNYFNNLCPTDHPKCNQQSLRLNLVYTFGAFTATGSAFFSGALFDRYGPVVTNLTSLVIMIFAFSLMGVGGPACQVSLMHINNLFPTYYSSISTSFSGMYVASSFVFKIFQIIATNYGVQVSELFLYYMGLVIIIILPTIFLMHHKAYLPIEEYKAKVNRTIIEDEETTDEAAGLLNDDEKTSMAVNHDPYLVMKHRPFIKQLSSWHFYILVIFMSFNSLHNVYYVGIVDDIFKDKPLYVNAFNYIWNGGVLFVPICGFLMMKFSLPNNGFIVNTIGILFGICSCIPVPELQFASFVFLSFQNVYIWGFKFVYLGEVFSYDNFGKLLGIGAILVAIIVFGWSPLEQEMVKQGAFKYLCEPGESECKSQELRLNLVYTLGAFTATGSAVGSGAIFDKYGPVWTSALSLVIMILGCICWYITDLVNENLYILSFALLGIGGPACQVSLIHICNLFPAYASTISTSFSGVFVGSSFVFKVFSIIAQNGVGCDVYSFDSADAHESVSAAARIQRESSGELRGVEGTKQEEYRHLFASGHREGADYQLTTDCH